MAIQGFSPNIQQKIMKDLSDKIDKQLLDNQDFFDSEAKSSLLSFDKPVFKSGATQEHTTAKVILSDMKKTIKLSTEGNLIGKEGYWYPRYPYEGIGTSEKYGPRPWLEVAAKKIRNAMGWK